MPGDAVDVVVVTMRDTRLVELCLSDLEAQTLDHRVAVVLNGAFEGPTEHLLDLHPAIDLVLLSDSVGYGAAMNAGIEAGTGPIVVVLNDDVRLRPSFLERLAAQFSRDPRVGMVTPLVLNPDETTVDTIGLEVDRTLAVFPGSWGEPAPSHMEGRRPIGPAGAAAAYRRVALAQVGGFDERIFLYSEDADLDLRIAAAGWQGEVALDAVAVHLGSATMGRHSPAQVARRSWSRGYLLRKYGVMRSPLNAPRVVIADGTTVLWQLVRWGDTSGLRGRIAGWRAARRSAEIPPGSVDRSITLAEGMKRRKRYRG